MDTESSVVLQEGGGVDGGGRGYGGINGNGKNTIKIFKIIKCFVILLKLPWGHYNYYHLCYNPALFFWSKPSYF